MACKAWKPVIPLWILFVAVQLVDIVWAFLVLLGIEKVRIIPGFTATNPFDLYYMPFTHSLPGAIFWSVGAAVVYRAVAPAQKWTAAAIVGGAVNAPAGVSVRYTTDGTIPSETSILYGSDNSVIVGDPASAMLRARLGIESGDRLAM